MHGCRRLAVSYLPPTPAWSIQRSSPWTLMSNKGRESAQSRHQYWPEGNLSEGTQTTASAPAPWSNRRG